MRVRVRVGVRVRVRVARVSGSEVASSRLACV